MTDERTRAYDQAPASRGGWELWRQDDAGVRYLVSRHATEADAAVELARFEALQHKQIYWIQAPSQRE